MTKAGKVLTVLVTFFSVAFAGLVAVNSAAHNDWKAIIADFSKEKIDAQKKELETLDSETTKWDARLKEAKAANAQDLGAIKRRITVLEKQLDQLNAKASELAVQIAAKGKEVQAIQDETKLRREDAVLIRNQLAELRAQKESAQAEQNRLKDLLVQAEGTLERVDRRRQLLESDGAGVDGEGDDPKINPKKSSYDGKPKSVKEKPAADPEEATSEEEMTDDNKKEEMEKPEDGDEPEAEKSEAEKSDADKPEKEKPTDEKPTEPEEDKPSE